MSARISLPMVYLAALALLATAAARPQAPKGARSLAIAFSEAEKGGFEETFSIARSVGIDSAQVFLAWSQIETAPGRYRAAGDPQNFLAIANVFYGQVEKLPIQLSLLPVITQARTMPADLAVLPFDHPDVISRFEALLDYAFSQLPDVEVESLSVGSELAALLGEDPTLWAQYTRFFEAIHAYVAQHPVARRRWPGLEVGTELTWDTLTGSDTAGLARTLNARADTILVSYYPLSDFRVRPPSTVRGDFDRLVELYPDSRPIRFLQLGYPSGYYSSRYYDLSRLTPELGSSAQKQARFVEEVFGAWDRWRGRIPLITFTWLHDVSQETVDLWVHEDPSFRLPGVPGYAEFLRTLGLRVRDGHGVDKPAMATLRREAAARGWGSGAAVPAAPQNLAAAASSTSAIALAWSDRSSDETQFVIEQRRGGAPYEVVAVVPADTTSAMIDGLEPAAPYTFRVHAENAIGASAFSNEALATTNAELGACRPDGGSLCLSGDRFRVTVLWADPARPGVAGAGTPAPYTGDTGLFWFFDPANVELTVKILDGRGINGHFWVFFGSLTDVEFWLTASDGETGAARTYYNAPHSQASVGDTEAF